MLGAQDRAHQQASSSSSAKYCPFPRQICRHWPIRAPHNPVAPMLKALVTAAECTLEHDIPSVAVSASRIPGHELLRQDVLSALNDLDVYGWNRLDQDTMQIAYVLGLTGICSPYLTPDDPGYRRDPEQLVMSVEYTRSSTTATLWAEDCGSLEQRGQIHSTKLGHDALEACRKTGNGSCDKDFMTALRSVSKEQIGTKKGTLGSVLLYGEQANDKSMTTMLRQVLREQFTNGESVDFSKAQELSEDQNFAGSRAAAWLEWEAKAREQLESQHDAAEEL